MSIVRKIHNKENPFVQINKEALWDQNLSLDAVGLWARILSRPDNWAISVSELCKSCKCGKEKIYRLLTELIEAGYAYRRQPVLNGRYQRYETHVFEYKLTREEIKEMFTLPDFPLAVSSVTENTDTNNKDTNNKDKKEKERESPPTIYQRDGKVKIELSAFNKLEEEFGREKIKEMIARLNEYADINPKRFNAYANHSTVIRKWIREDKQKASNLPYNQRSDNQAHKDSQLIDELIKTNPELAQKKLIDKGNGYVEFRTYAGNYYDQIKFGEHGFKERVLLILRKMGVPIKELSDPKVP